jgi:hypothetical protein
MKRKPFPCGCTSVTQVCQHLWSPPSRPKTTTRNPITEPQRRKGLKDLWHWLTDRQHHAR